MDERDYSCKSEVNMRAFSKTTQPQINEDKQMQKQNTASTNDMTQQKAFKTLIGQGFTKKAQGHKECVLLAYEMFEPVINLTSNAHEMRRNMNDYMDL